VTEIEIDGAGGAVRCTPPSLHTLTNLSVAGRFLPTRVEAIEEPGGRWWLRASPHFLPNAVARVACVRQIWTRGAKSDEGGSTPGEER
jgi:hypothetical protein